MTTVRRALVHPVTPAVAALALSAATLLAVLPARPLALTVLVWTLLGVTAGYSISGSV
ncbi:hypothetical protein [Micromonospora sp. WMMD812]|uniref:hypothetical protein n=1 Tax=Micromonospora sp. WMMD812 TaxID=3015152 RepID=UPI00248A91F0|nr:hypothetical protein [Micromonospora sp. WMMD812]WBB70080.1 hypothetical protein O7603_12245 [Micromonospora sp. WMMD812]